MGVLIEVGMGPMYGTSRTMKSARPLIFGAILGLAGILACATPASAAGIDDNAAVLARLDADWSNSAVKRNVEVLASYYSEDAVVYPPNDMVIVGRVAAKKFWASGLADPTYSISWKTVNTRVSSSGDLGFTGGTYEESYKGTDGKTVKNTGKYLTIWAKDKNGDWKVIHDIWNADK
jgi:ketosteroid isomerase-like protein